MTPNIIPYRKEFLAGLTGMGGGPTGLALGGAVAKKTYLNDVFSTQLYVGNAGTKTITNGVDLSTDGGLVITKYRNSGNDWAWGSTTNVLGTGRYINSNSIGQRQNDANSYTSFNTDGYTIGSSSTINQTNVNGYVSYSFKKIPGFLDIVEYTGNNASSRDISHNLGSTPGWIITMCATKGENKASWHSGLDSPKWLVLDSTNSAQSGSGNVSFPQMPTNTQFTIGSYNNISGETYIAWIFAGGESQAAGARSVDFDQDSIGISPSGGTAQDLTFGTANFTIEFWAKPDNFTNRGTFYDSRPSNGSTGITIGHEATSGQIRVYMNAGGGGDIVVQSDDFWEGIWQHIAVTRTSGTVRLFINGVLKDSATRTSDMNNVNDVVLGYRSFTGSSYSWFDGKMSNLRVQKYSQYQTSFKPSVEPLTDITFTTLLMLQNTGPKVATVTPGTLSDSGSPTVIENDSPFSDPEEYVFGDDGKQNLISTGSYIGNGTSGSEPQIYLGWEPQWVMIKNSSSGSTAWQVFDSMRGMADADPAGTSHGNRLELQSTAGDVVGASGVTLMSDGFSPNGTGSYNNSDGDKFVYVAIRRPDGLVAKPEKVATNVFAIDEGNNKVSVPVYESGFPVDFGITKQQVQNKDWEFASRLTGKTYLKSPNNGPQTSNNDYIMDFQNGWGEQAGEDDDYCSWMWQRHQGFDVQVYMGTGLAAERVQNMGTTPEMMWVKRRTGTDTDWVVYHKDMGTYPQDYYLKLNSNAGVTSGNQWWKPPTSTHWFTAIGGLNNINNAKYMALLFSSVNGISKVGTYAGTGASGNSQNFGFQPRFLIVKKFSTGAGAAASGGWHVLDTLRGWGAGNDSDMELQNTAAAVTQIDWGAPTATGWDMGNNDIFNESGYKFIYYAHA